MDILCVCVFSLSLSLSLSLPLSLSLSLSLALSLSLSLSLSAVLSVVCHDCYIELLQCLLRDISVFFTDVFSLTDPIVKLNITFRSATLITVHIPIYFLFVCSSSLLYKFVHEFCEVVHVPQALYNSISTGK